MASILSTIVLLSFSSLAACGFEPLYGERTATSVTSDLATIDVAPIKNRVGQELRNFLIDRLSPQGPLERTRYRLAVSLDTSTTPLLIQLDNTATRFNLRINAQFSLQDLQSDEVVFSGDVRSLSGFNLADSEYATLVAEQNASTRAAREVSDKIQTLLSLYFDRQADSG